VSSRWGPSDARRAVDGAAWSEAWSNQLSTLCPAVQRPSRIAPAKKGKKCQKEEKARDKEQGEQTKDIDPSGELPQIKDRVESEKRERQEPQWSVDEHAPNSTHAYLPNVLELKPGSCPACDEEGNARHSPDSLGRRPQYVRKEWKQGKRESKEAHEDHGTKSGYIERKRVLGATTAKERDQTCEARKCDRNLGGSQ